MTHRACVHLVAPDGNESILYPGDMIGRSLAAGMRLDDIRVSEAHALVSLRGGQMKLLALRGMLAIDEQPTTEVTLQAGQTVQLASGVSLGVSRVRLPEHLLALEGDDLPQTLLQGHAASLLLEPRVRIEARYLHGAPAYLWSNGEGWSVRVGDNPSQQLDEGVSFHVAGHTFKARRVAIASTPGHSTHHSGKLHPPLRLIVNYDTASIERERMPPVGLGGISARILSELVALDGPAHWSAIAETVWRKGDPHRLRRRWDSNISRLRQKLREAEIRPDLVRADGTGQFELFLYPGDEVVDRT